MNSQKHILLVEDDDSMGFLLKDSLENYNFKVTLFSNGKLALNQFNNNSFDICLLDVMMPIMDGFSLAKEIRKLDTNIPIVFLTAKSMKEDKINGFKIGADDYITKPVKPKVLVSKVKSLLRRLKTEGEVDTTTKIGDIVINRDEYVVFKGDKKIALPRKEFELFSLLTSKPGKVFKREVILDSVWGNEVVVGGRTIDVHIRKLREKIGDDFFKTVKGVGYKFVLEGSEK